MKIEIKSLVGSLLFEGDFNNLRDAVVAAVKGRKHLNGADLRGAYLRGAYLEGAYLRGAYLEGADLEGADLEGAYLEGADLRGADLEGAYLRGAYLRGVKNLPESYINQCSRDMLFVFQHLKSELPGLRKALIEGKVNGSQYEGKCACLIGTLAKQLPKNGNKVDKVCSRIPFYDKGTHNLGEQWFWNIREGDTPENSFFAKHALMLIDSVLDGRGRG